MSAKTPILLIKLAITAALLWFVFQQTEITQVADRLDQMRWPPLLAAIAFLTLQAIGVTTWRWHTVVRLTHCAVPACSLLRIVTIGLFFNQMLPTNFGGDGARIWLLSRLGIPLDGALRSVVIDRALGLFSLLLLVVTTTPIVLLTIDRQAEIAGLLILALAGFGLIAAIKLTGPLLRRVRWKWARKYIATFWTDFETLLRERSALGWIIVVSMLGHAVTCLAIWLIAQAFEIQVSAWMAMVVVAPVILATALPVSIAGWGVREGSMVFALGVLGVTASDAALVSVVIGLVGLLLGAVGGLVWLPSMGRYRATGLVTPTPSSIGTGDRLADPEQAEPGRN
jgi:uncharacterized protein (TIRG00374 family)